MPLPSIYSGWLESQEDIKENQSHYWGHNPPTLITASNVRSFTVGSGLNIYDNTLIPEIESAEHEVILVTCFWVQSTSLSHLSAALLLLSDKALSRCDGTKIRVRIGFSSRSPSQMILHTSSSSGYIYPEFAWTSKLGLPPAEDLVGLDLQVKSIFIRPFSVMHPKFVIIDRDKALMPSCNVSWESWLECCIALDGAIVEKLVDFWHHFWGQGDLPDLGFGITPKKLARVNASTSRPSASSPISTSKRLSPDPTILLPSPHHATFLDIVPFVSFGTSPPTPLTTFLLHLFATAEKSIQILTPNLTHLPVISALISALERGIDITVITNRRMMVLEQLLTAGTITEFRVWNLARVYQRLRRSAKKAEKSISNEAELEEGRHPKPLGNLKIGYFRPNDETVKTHIKCTVVDRQTIILGSGNMDRASWSSSQELGVAFYGRDAVDSIWDCIEADLRDRVEAYYPKEATKGNQGSSALDSEPREGPSVKKKAFRARG